MKMKKFLLFLTVLSFQFAIAQETVEVPFITIGEDEISAEEFMMVYNKNKDIGNDIDPKTPEEYLDLYINFKLKVYEAKMRGMDTLPSFIREFNSYRDQLAAPYMTEKEISSALISEAYERMKFEVNASHIMLDLSNNAVPEDTLKVYKELMNIKNQIEKGSISFEEAAKKYSSDTYSAERDGNLGYFTVFAMVYPFETAAYTTEIGAISNPIRTQFGYHLVKVLDKRPANGKISVSHIFLKEEPGKETSAQIQIKEIYARLQQGEDFGLLAKQFSQDPNSAKKYGQLPPFGINTMMPEFEAQAFALQNPGDFSEPFQTSMGWHIVMLHGKEGVPEFETVKSYLENKVNGDARSNKTQEVFLANLKKEYDLKTNPKRLKKLMKVLDDSYLNNKWKAVETPKGFNKTLFSFADQEKSLADFYDYVIYNQSRGKKSNSLEEEIYKQYNLFIDQTILAYRKEHLEDIYPEFKQLVNEYRDGILLFDLTEEMVWNKALEDSAGIADYYAAHKDEFQWDERLEGRYFNVVSKDIANKVKRDLGRKIDPTTLPNKYNVKSQLNVNLLEGTFTKDQLPFSADFAWKSGVYGPFEQDERFYILQVDKTLPKMNKELNEVKGIIISEYQKELENAWVEELREKYPVSIDRSQLKSLFSEVAE